MDKYHPLALNRLNCPTNALLGSELFDLFLSLHTCYSYDPVQDSWKRLADMQEFRSNFSVVVHGKLLYAIGGDKEINTNVDSVEMYDPGTDSWR